MKNKDLHNYNCLYKQPKLFKVNIIENILLSKTTIIRIYTILIFKNKLILSYRNKKKKYRKKDILIFKFIFLFYCC